MTTPARWKSRVLLLLIIACLAACAPSGGNGQGATAPASATDSVAQTPIAAMSELTVDQMSDEYWAAWDDLKLPDGVEPVGSGTWDPEPGLDGELVGHVFEPGYGLTMAQYEWTCAWMGEWLATYNDDAARAESAMAELDTAPGFELFTTYSDAGTRQALVEQLSAAALGDPGPMSRHVQLNCS